MQITIPAQTVEVPSMSGTPAEVGQWMADTALGAWYTYDDEGTFRHKRMEINGETYYSIVDEDEEKSVEFTATQFFEKHAVLIWMGTISNYRHDWIDFAFKSKGADPDEYDTNTCDAVFQNMLYGTIVYG